MMTNNTVCPAPPNRRRFFKLLGLTAGSLAFKPMPTQAGQQQASYPSTPSPISPSLKIGVILAQSSLHPNLSENWLSGFRTYWTQDPLRRPQSIMTTMAQQPSDALGLARKLLIQDKVDVMVGMVSAPIAAQLHALCEQFQTVLIASDAGAHVLQTNTHSPYVFHSTLNHVQANWTMGQFAAQQLGRRAFIATSFYESGYDSLYAFRHGFESAGGVVIDTLVSHQPNQDESLADVIAAIKQARPDFVYALYGGAQAVEFVRAYAEAGLTTSIPLAGSSFMVDESLLPTLGAAALGIRSVASWSPALHTPENRALTAAFMRQHGRQPDAFAVLGYDAAHLIAVSATATSDEGSATLALMSALRSAAFVGPRGALQMDMRTHMSRTPLYLREVRQQDGIFANVVINTLDDTSDPLIASLQGSARSGWTNAYLCI